jgi:hypothetical protein
MSTINTLDEFGKRVVKQSRQNLTKKKKNASKELYNSLSYNIAENNGTFVLSFSMADYGEFVDKGVRGIGGTKADGSKYVLKKVTNNNFKYKKGIQNKPSRKHFDKWIVKRGIAPRNSSGQFTTRIGLAIAISYHVWHTGLETTNFFTTPLEQNFNKLSDDLLNSFANDIIL